MYKIIEGVDIDTICMNNGFPFIISMNKKLSENEERNKIIMDTINNIPLKMLVVFQFKSHLEFIRNNIQRDNIDFIPMFDLNGLSSEFLDQYEILFFATPFHNLKNEIICFRGMIIELEDNNPIFKRWIRRHKFCRDLSNS